jgi:hypothetical protein
MALFVFYFLSSCSTDSIDIDKAQNVNNDYVIPETKVIEVNPRKLINDYRLSRRVRIICSNLE